MNDFTWPEGGLIVNDENPKVFGLVWLCLGQCCKSESGNTVRGTKLFKCDRFERRQRAERGPAVFGATSCRFDSSFLLN